MADVFIRNKRQKGVKPKRETIHVDEPIEVFVLSAGGKNDANEDDVSDEEICRALEAAGCIVRLVSTNGGWLAAARGALWVARHVGAARLVFCAVHPLALAVLRCLAAPRLAYIQRTVFLENPLWSRCLHQVLLRLADDVIVHSRDSADLYQSLFCNCKAPKIIYPCTDTGTMQVEETTSILKVIPDLSKYTNIYITYGSFYPESNFELVIDAFNVMCAKIQKRNRDEKVKLVIAGDLEVNDLDQRQYYRYIQNYLVTKACACQVLILKRLTPVRKKTLLAYSVCAVFAVAHARLLLEALYAGRAIIVTSGATAKELVSRRVGFRVSATPKDLARVLLLLQSDTRLAEQLGRNAKEHYLQNFSFLKFTHKLHNFVNGNTFQCQTCLEFYRLQQLTQSTSDMNISCSNCTHVE